jgi:hypothetical protein
MEQEFQGDSYIVYITPPSTTFPWVTIYKRRKRRRRGEIAEEKMGEASTQGFGSEHAFDTMNIDKTAHQIGRAILDNSSIIRHWRTHRT